jgi:hypothetical protein
MCLGSYKRGHPDCTGVGNWYCLPINGGVAESCFMHDHCRGFLNRTVKAGSARRRERSCAHLIECNRSIKHHTLDYLLYIAPKYTHLQNCMLSNSILCSHTALPIISIHPSQPLFIITYPSGRKIYLSSTIMLDAAWRDTGGQSSSG